jgi:predicted Rossmann fold nucleotide-binding protein DprA/Smf involved in DNA uptake
MQPDASLSWLALGTGQHALEPERARIPTYPASENFPVRDRVVVGMPLGVVVVEGAQYSGSLITARLAMEFGREVLGVPGNVTQPVSFAPNQLIKQSAKLVTATRTSSRNCPRRFARLWRKPSNRNPNSGICWRLQRQMAPKRSSTN